VPLRWLGAWAAAPSRVRRRWGRHPSGGLRADPRTSLEPLSEAGQRHGSLFEDHRLLLEESEIWRRGGGGPRRAIAVLGCLGRCSLSGKAEVVSAPLGWPPGRPTYLLGAPPRGGPASRKLVQGPPPPPRKELRFGGGRGCQRTIAVVGGVIFEVTRRPQRKHSLLTSGPVEATPGRGGTGVDDGIMTQEWMME
jgi:hypothetical protein